jgi:hypothetical protein
LELPLFPGVDDDGTLGAVGVVVVGALLGGFGTEGTVGGWGGDG